MANCGLGVGLILTILIAFLVNESSTLECYKCVSNVGEDCGTFQLLNTSTTNAEKQTCGADQVCATVIESEPSGAGEKIKRDCYPKGYCTNKAPPINQCNECENRKLCNSSSSKIPSFVIMGFLSYVLFKTVF